MDQLKSTISAVVLARNEEKRIEKCLSGLSWVDEVIVIDNNSSDDTVKIAKKHRAKVSPITDSNFSHLRTMGRDRATCDWILYIDADEIVPLSLRDEIKKTVTSHVPGAPVGFFIRRKNYYLGHPWPVQDKMQRLFLRKSLKQWQGEVHETAVVDGSIGELSAPLLHDTHRTLEEMVEKTNEWSAVEAKLRYQIGHPPVVWWRLIRVFLTGFIRSFFIQGGWRAGIIGWIESIYQGFSLFITYSKLWELQQSDRTQ